MVSETKADELYKLCIEALGKRAPKKSVLNMLNHVISHSDDAKLRRLVEELSVALCYTGTEPSAMPVRQLNACKAIAAKVDARCSEMLGR